MGTILTQRRHFVMKMVGIILVLAALAAGMAGCVQPPPSNLQIRDWYDLHAVRDNLRGNHRLMNDLDATTAGYEELASPTANGGRGWQPIGTWNPTTHVGTIFEGTLDGQGYQIRDLFINRPDEYSVGLFGAVSAFYRVEEGIIEHVGVVNATVTGGSYVGALVGCNMVMSEPGTVRNSYSTGNVTGRDYVGGLVGWNAGTVSNCYATGSVAGNSSVGGLAGRNAGTVSSCYSVAGVTGHDQVGGLAGANLDAMSNSYCSGNVTGLTNVGGLVGFNDDTVSSCYSSAWVTAEQNVGGLVGANEGTVSDSFWDVEASAIEESDGGTGKTTAEMQNITTFVDASWDITTVAPGERSPAHAWNMIDGAAYPFLSWQLVY
jgi:hypothetical protein